MQPNKVPIAQVLANWNIITHKTASIADHYGLLSQLNQASEECGELITAISKFRRSHGEGQPVRDKSVDYRKALLSEVADVQVMLFELTHLLSGYEEVANEVLYKLHRTQDIIWLEGENNGQLK